MPFEIRSFFEFKDIPALREIRSTREMLLGSMDVYEIFGTIILADEGYNASICGTSAGIEGFIADAETILDTTITGNVTQHCERPFRRREVKIKAEIVSLRRTVDRSFGTGKRATSSEWNLLLRDPEVFVLDARNDYEFTSGTFAGAVNPQTVKFSELPAFVAGNLDPDRHRKVAMFCTGGIRCEKFAPYLIEQGFEEVYQLDGGILRYLDETDPENSLWQGECFVFDTRTTLDTRLEKGTLPDNSPRSAVNDVRCVDRS
ncbi:MAG: rhodanese-like domain-containing protein [Acidobacteriota bacterium]